MKLRSKRMLGNMYISIEESNCVKLNRLGRFSLGFYAISPMNCEMKNILHHLPPLSLDQKTEYL